MRKIRERRNGKGVKRERKDIEKVERGCVREKRRNEKVGRVGER